MRQRNATLKTMAQREGCTTGLSAAVVNCQRGPPDHGSPPSRSLESRIIPSVLVSILVSVLASLFLPLLLLSALVLVAPVLAENATQPEAGLALSRLTRDVDALRDEGYPTARFDDAVMDMQLLYAQGDYVSAMLREAETRRLIEAMLAFDGRRQTVEELLKEAERFGLDATGPRLSLTQAESEYGKLNYEGAKAHQARAFDDVILLLEPKSGEAMARASALAAELEQAGIPLAKVNETVAGLEAAARERDYLSLFLLARDLESMDASIRSLIDLEREIALLRSEGYPTTRLRDRFLELERLFSEGSYPEFGVFYAETGRLIASVYATAELNARTRARIGAPEVLGIDFSRVEDLLVLSDEELALENYERARDYAKEASTLAEETEQDHLFMTVLNRAKGRLNLFAFLRVHWWQSLIVVSILSLLALVGLTLGKTEYLALRIRRLVHERETIRDLLTRLQWDYYKLHVIDKESFIATTNQYQQRLDTIDETLPLLLEEHERSSQRGLDRAAALLRSKFAAWTGRTENAISGESTRKSIGKPIGKPIGTTRGKNAGKTERRGPR